MNKRRVSIAEAKARLSELTAGGERIVLTERGVPVATVRIVLTERGVPVASCGRSRHR